MGLFLRKEKGVTLLNFFFEDWSTMKHEKITAENVTEKYEYIFADWVKELNIEFCEVRERYVRAKFKNKAKFRFFSGAVCGQVLMAVVDTVMSVAMGTTETPVRGTLSQNNNFVKPATADFFYVECSLQKTGKSIAIGETKIFSGENKDLICHSTSIYPVDNLKT